MSDRWATARGVLTERSGIHPLAMALFSGVLVLLIFLPMETSRAWTQEKHENGTPLKRNGREVDMELRFGGGTSETCSPKAEGVELYEFGPCWDDVIKSAADQWYRTDARVRINFKSSSVEPGCTFGDGINTVTLGDNYCGREFGEQTLGVAFYRYNPRGIILESNVVFNTAFSWNSYSGPLRRVSAEVPLIDMHRVAIHEFGHVWGLDHPDEAGQEVVAIMNSKYGNIDRLQQDDIDGIVGIYGADPINPPVASSGNIELDDTGTLTIDEGGTGTFTVKLDTEPVSEVTVTITSADTGVVNVNPSSLTFAASNHSIAQEVIVTALHDIDIADESVDITLSASGGIMAEDVKKGVAINDDDEAGSLVMSPSPLQVVEGGQERLLVRLGAAPTVSGVVVNLAATNPAVTLSPASLTFTAGNWSANQTVIVSVNEDGDGEIDSDTITGSYLNATGNYASAAGARGATIELIILDRPGDIVTSAQMVDLVEGGDAVEFTVRLDEAPVNTDYATISLSNSNRDISVTPTVLLFTRDNWNAERIVSVQAGEDDDQEEDYDFIVLSGTGGNYSRSMTKVSISVEENDDNHGVIGGTLGRNGVYALAIPPESGSDSSDIRIHCKQSSRCAVYFDCSAQEDGVLFQGWLPELIPAWGARTVRASDIVRYTGGLSWSGKGRLGCLLRSEERIGAQVWTRSGDGVLVNNSALLKSALDSKSGKQRADIESIPSPDGSEKTNLRIRCLAPEDEHCTGTVFSCYTDDGTLHEGELGRIDRVTVRHIQTSELSSLIDYRWRSMGLSCELRSDNHFTVQVMSRTGGGGALVNNSAR